MKVAIHKGHIGFAERWIRFCESNGLSFELVDCHDSEIIESLRTVDVLLWNWLHDDYRSKLNAPKLIFALEQIGVKVFPDFSTSVNYDDKLGQKYQFEALNLPHAKMSVFFDADDCDRFVNKNGYPFVAKSRGGAGASNVYLIKSKSDLKRLYKYAFKNGYPLIDRNQIFFDSIKNFFRSPNSATFKRFLSGLYRLFFKTAFEKHSMREKGYVLVQEFLPNNDHDIRIIVIGDKAFGIKRLCRVNDFRASGSGSILYDRADLDLDCVKLAFDATDKLAMQCAAFDFVYDQQGRAKIIEVSYAFSVDAYDYCPGYFDRELNWIESSFNPQEWMIIERLGLKDD